jgi:glutamate 5-kinase
MKVVVKVGSSSITSAAGAIDDGALGSLARQIVDAAEAGHRPVLVSSGAIAAGVGAMHLDIRPTDIVDLQALAAIGQGRLMARYAEVFSERGVVAGQVLLTGYDFGNRRAYLNARATLGRLLDMGVVPIVNENDTVATDEIRLGENDRLAALVATLVGADLLLVLTDQPGLFSSDPRLNAEASLIEEVASIDEDLEAAAGASGTAFGSGGMASKIAAAKIATWSGIPCVIAGATEPAVVARAIAGDGVGTTVRPRERRLAARKVWIAFAQPSRGHLQVDDGAARALTQGGRSLLPVGVKVVDGTFEAGDAVEIRSQQGALVAKGLAAHGAEVLRSLVGRRSADLPAGVPEEAVHRDDLVVLTD